ncbi:MAG: ethanolamine ammonia-lyase subunit EutC [Acidobacteriaceae bacterium]|jgi:ethanolamine ammonia-lyase small subunit
MPPPVPDRSLHTTTTAVNLRDHTPARVALASTGVSITTRHALEFSLAHAQARDAVHAALAVPSLLAALRDRNLSGIHVRSAVPDRAEYLRRPDLGRTLAPASAALLQPATSNLQPATLLTLILADGLSALATERHALSVLDALLPLLDPTWQLTPIVIAEQARVALADEIGQGLHADATVILIGERPGLSSPDSLGAYITWSPRPGRTDAERNCVSNIRPPLAGESYSQAGLDYSTAAARIARTLTEGRRLGLTGVALRESGSALPP